MAIYFALLKNNLRTSFNFTNMNNYYISIIGNMASGKTTMTKIFAEKLNFTPFYESFRNNPFLPKYYQKPQEYSLESQLFFLLEKTRQAKQIKNKLLNNSVIQDSHLLEDVYMYGKTLEKNGDLPKDEADLYFGLVDLIVPNLPQVNLFIYLKVPIEILESRIKQRVADEERPYESRVDVSYLKQLQESLEGWVSGIQNVKVLETGCGNKDVVDDEQWINEQAKLMKEKLNIAT